MSHSEFEGFCPLNDTQWRAIRMLMPPELEVGRRRSTSLRAVVDAIRYRDVARCGWRALPKRFPNWSTVHSYFTAWKKSGLLDVLRRRVNLVGCTPHHTGIRVVAPAASQAAARITPCSDCATGNEARAGCCTEEATGSGFGV